MWISTLKTLPNIPDVKNFRYVFKGEHIFPFSVTGRKLDLARSSGLVKGNTKNTCVLLKLMVVYLKEERQAGDSVQW